MTTSVTTEIISKGIDLIGQIFLYSRRNAQENKFKVETRGDAKGRIDQLQVYIDEELAKIKTQKESFPVQTSARQTSIRQTDGGRMTDPILATRPNSSPQGLAAHQGGGIGRPAHYPDAPDNGQGTLRGADSRWGRRRSQPPGSDRAPRRCSGRADGDGKIRPVPGEDRQHYAGREGCHQSTPPSVAKYAPTTFEWGQFS